MDITGRARWRMVALLWSLVLVSSLLIGAGGPAAGAVPPPPSGAVVLTAGQVPRRCTAEDGAWNAYATNFGVYWSSNAKAWLSAPWCYPRWGNLMATASGVVRSGQAFTVTAIPTDGSNSGQYAPETKSISWSYPGTVVSGCGNADLSCTVIPTAKAGKEWIWSEFKVSMPRTFFIDSPGEFCAGQHLCPGATTHAWAWVGVPPQDGKLHIRGTVRDADGEGVRGVRVTATGAGGGSDRTDAGGGYDIVVKKGSYSVTAAGDWCVVGRPGCAASVRVTLPGSRTVDFRARPEHTLSGRVLERTCDNDSCTETGLGNVVVRATGGPGEPGSTVTAADGAYSLTLTEGTWRVTPRMDGRSFEHVDADGEGDGAAFASVRLDRDRSGVDFRACASEDAEPGVDDPPTVRPAATGRGCKHLKVQIIRIKAAGDTGWTESSGKKLLGHPRVPVGFSQPTRNGDFQWQCRTGCMNVRIRVTDRATGRVLPSASVTVSVLAAPGAVTADSPNGVVCPALPFAEGCGERIRQELDHQRDLDVYYWLPGVIERTNARIYVQVTAPGYPRLKKTQNVVIQANAPLKRTFTFRAADADTLVWWGSLKQGLKFADLGSYCDKVLAALNDMAGGGLSAGYLAVVSKYAGTLFKQLEAKCGLLDFGQLVAKLSIITPWKLYTWFLPRFGVPPNGLLGTSHIINRPAQLVLNFAGFFDAFNDGLVAYLYDRVDLTDPSTPDLRGNPLRLEIFEVSHRVASGKVKDALYLRFTGKQQGVPTKETTAYVVGGYYPGCWLNPRLNRAEFSWFDLDPCRTIEP